MDPHILVTIIQVYLRLSVSTKAEAYELSYSFIVKGSQMNQVDLDMHINCLVEFHLLDIVKRFTLVLVLCASGIHCLDTTSIVLLFCYLIQQRRS